MCRVRHPPLSTLQPPELPVPTQGPSADPSTWRVRTSPRQPGNPSPPPPPQTSSSPGSSGAFSIPGAFSGRDVRGANPRGIQQGLAKGGPRPRWVLGTLPPTSHFLPSSAQPQLKEFSRAGTPARQSPAGTEPGQGEIPRDGDTAGASVLQERGHVAQVIRRSMQPRRQPRNTRINLLGQNRL